MGLSPQKLWCFVKKAFKKSEVINIGFKYIQEQS